MRVERSHHGNRVPRPSTRRRKRLRATYHPYSASRPQHLLGRTLSTSLQCQHLYSAPPSIMTPTTIWARYRQASRHKTVCVFPTTTIAGRQSPARLPCRPQARRQVLAGSSTKSWARSLEMTIQACKMARAGKDQSRAQCIFCPLSRLVQEGGIGTTRSMSLCVAVGRRVRRARYLGRQHRVVRLRLGHTSR